MLASESRMVYSRILISNHEELSKGGIGGEWVTRQFLRNSEVEVFKTLEGHGDQAHGQDIVIAGIRGLPRVIEIDNALLRSVMKHYTHNMGLSVCVMVSTMQHSAHTPYSAYYDDLADEPYFTVILLKTKGGSSIRRS